MKWVIAFNIQPSTTSLIQCSNCFKSSTGNLQGCGRAQKDVWYVHKCIRHTSLPFTDHFTEGMSYGTFSSTRESSTFFVFQARRTVTKDFFWFFFCFSFRKGHSLELEIARKPIQWVKDPKKACDLILMRFHHLIVMRWRQKAKTADANGVNVFLRKVMIKARFRRRSTHVPNLTDESSTAKEWQFGTAVLVWCGKSVKFHRVCRTFVKA